MHIITYYAPKHTHIYNYIYIELHDKTTRFKQWNWRIIPWWLRWKLAWLPFEPGFHAFLAILDPKNHGEMMWHAFFSWSSHSCRIADHRSLHHVVLWHLSAGNRGRSTPAGCLWPPNVAQRSKVVRCGSRTTGRFSLQWGFPTMGVPQ